MLDDILTPEERAVVARARAFAEQHVAPHAARWEWERRYPLETIKAACAARLHTIELAREHGGQGLSFSCKLRAFEEIAARDFAFAFALINHHNAVARLARDGQPTLVVGAAGGRKIPGTVLQILLASIDFEMNVQEAIDAPRISHQWLPDVILYEPFGLSADTVDALSARGHTLSERPASEWSRAHGIALREGMLEGGSDRRKPDGAAIGR